MADVNKDLCANAASTEQSVCVCVSVDSMLSAAAEERRVVLKGKQMAALCSLLTSCTPAFICTSACTRLGSFHVVQLAPGLHPVLIQYHEPEKKAFF